MRRFKEKLNKKGFTLAELLIVVAIIAVLVAVSVPVFNSKLERAREATDIANLRAAKVAVSADYLNGDIKLDGTGKAVVYYDADNGVLRDSSSDIKAYGQGTKVNGNTSYGDYMTDSENQGKLIQITLQAKESGTDTSKVSDADTITYTYKLLKPGETS